MSLYGKMDGTKYDPEAWMKCRFCGNDLRAAEHSIGCPPSVALTEIKRVRSAIAFTKAALPRFRVINGGEPND